MLHSFFSQLTRRLTWIISVDVLKINSPRSAVHIQIDLWRLQKKTPAGLIPNASTFQLKLCRDVMFTFIPSERQARHPHSRTSSLSSCYQLLSLYSVVSSNGPLQAVISLDNSKAIHAPSGVSSDSSNLSHVRHLTVRIFLILPCRLVFVFIFFLWRNVSSYIFELIKKCFCRLYSCSNNWQKLREKVFLNVLCKLTPKKLFQSLSKCS